MKAFVTGGSGFIGRQLVRNLVSRGYEVQALARSQASALALRNLGAAIVPGDVRDRESMRAAMRGSDVVYHLAFACPYDPVAGHETEAVTVGGALNVLELAWELDVPRIVFSSTLAVYGDTHGAMIDESYYSGGPFDPEADKTRWRAHYEVADLLSRQGAPITIVVSGSTFGPGDTGWLATLMRRFLRGKLRAVPAPETTHTYAHVEDVAIGHILAAEKGRAGETYFLTGPAIPLNELVDFWAQLTGRPGPSLSVPEPLSRALPGGSEGAELRDMLGVTYAGRSDKAREELGWRTRPLQTGMLDTFEWIEATEPLDSGSDLTRWLAIGAIAAGLGLTFWFWRRGRRKSD